MRKKRKSGRRNDNNQHISEVDEKAKTIFGRLVRKLAEAVDYDADRAMRLQKIFYFYVVRVTFRKNFCLYG